MSDLNRAAISVALTATCFMLSIEIVRRMGDNRYTKTTTNVVYWAMIAATMAIWWL